MTDAFETAFVKIGADTSALVKGIQDIPGQLAAIQGSLDAKLAGITDSLSTKADSALRKVGDAVTSFGTTWSAAVSLPITGAGLAITNFGGDFEASMSRVQVLGEVGREDLKKLTDQAIELGIKTPFSAKAAADAMGEFAAQGFKANEIMGAMPGILGLAASGQVSTGQAAQVTSDILRGFGMEASEAGKVADVLAKAAANSSVGVSDLGNSFKYIGPVASAAGIDFEEAAAALEILGNAGIRGEKAGTGLQQMLNDLINPTDKAKDTIDRLGIKVTDAHGAMLPLKDIVQQFTDAQKNATSQTDFLKDATTIWGQRASDVLPLIKAGGEELDKQTIALQNSKGAAESMGNALMNNLKGSTDQLMGSLETLAITIYDTYGPSIRKAVDWATDLINQGIELAKTWKDQPQWAKDLELGIAALAAAAGPALLGLGAALKGLDTVGIKLVGSETLNLANLLKASPWAIAGIVGFWAGWESLKDLKGNIAEAKSSVSDLAQQLADGSAWQTAKGWIQALTQPLTGLRDTFGEAWNKLKTFADELGLTETVINTIKGPWNTFKGWIDDAWGSLKDLGDLFTGRIWGILRDSLTPFGQLNQAVQNFREGVDKLKDSLGLKTTAMKDMDKAAGDAARTLQDKVNAQMRNMGEQAGSLKTSLEILTTKTTGYHSEIDAGHPKIKAHGEKLGEAEKAAKKLADQIGGVKDEVERMFSKFNGATWDFAQFVEFESKGGNVKTAVQQIDAEMLKLRQKFEDAPGGLPPEIRGTILQLGLAKDKLNEFKKTAEEAKIEDAFQKLNAEILKTPGNVQAIPPEIVNMVENGIKVNMEAAAEAFKTTGAVLREQLTPEPLKTPWGDFGTKVFGDAGVLPNFIKALDVSKGGINGIANAAKALPDQLKDAFMGTVVKNAFDELDGRFEGLGTALFNVVNSTKDWKEKVKDVGNAFVTYVINQGIDKALKQMTLFETGLKNLGTNLSGIFKGVNDEVGSLTGNVNKLVTGTTSGLPTGTPGGAPGTPGGGGVPGGLGGIAGPLTAIFTGIDAIFSGLSYFTERRMEKDLGRIEVSTRETAADLANLRTDQWTRYNGMFDRLGELVNIADTGLGNIFDRIGELITTQRDNLNASVAGFGLVEAGGGGFELPEGASGGTGGVRDVYITVTGNTIQNDEELAALIMDQIFALLPTA